MLEKFENKAQKIDEMTPEKRNRYADFLRAASILVVVFGHWLLTYMTIDGGELQTERMLTMVPETQWLTWIFQVMPVFFFVGGFANAIGWNSARKKGQSYINWLRKRARRLLWPIVPLILFWIPVVYLLDWMGSPADLLSLVNHVVLIPLWFLAAYLLVILISPVAYWLHEKFGVGALVGFIVLAVVCDVAYRNGVPFVGWSNYLWVWAGVHQAGFFWYDDRLPDSPLKGVLLAIIGYMVLLGLVEILDYPLAVVGTGEATAEPGSSNNTPPSMALLALAVAQIGVLTALRRPFTRWLENSKLWALVVLMGSRLMTVYIWHMTALVAVSAAAYPTGLWPDPDGITALWWATRVPWLLILAMVLALLVIAFGRWERPREGRPTSLEGWPAKLKAVVGVVLTVGGLGTLITGGLYDTEGPTSVPVIPLIVFFAGLVALGVIGTRFFGRWVEAEPEPPEDGRV